jgi:hypothetical protein
LPPPHRTDIKRRTSILDKRQRIVVSIAAATDPKVTHENNLDRSIHESLFLSGGLF